MLFLRAELGRQPEALGAAVGAQPADPPVGAVFGEKGEILAALKARGGVAQRTADDLAAPALDLDTEPTIVGGPAAEIEPGSEDARNRQLVAVAAVNAEVEALPPLTLIENSGAIAVTGGGASHNIAIDLRANTTGAAVRQIAGAVGVPAASITGDILFGAGNDTLALGDKSSVTGTVDFGGGGDRPRRAP